MFWVTRPVLAEWRRGFWCVIHLYLHIMVVLREGCGGVVAWNECVQDWLKLIDFRFLCANLRGAIKISILFKNSSWYIWQFYRIKWSVRYYSILQINSPTMAWEGYFNQDTSKDVPMTTSHTSCGHTVLLSVRYIYLMDLIMGYYYEN